MLGEDVDLLLASYLKLVLLVIARPHSNIIISVLLSLFGLMNEAHTL